MRLQAGSLPWLIAHDLTLNWRRFIEMFARRRGRLAVPPLSRARSPCAGTPREVAGEPDRLEQRGQHADPLLDMRFEVHSRVQQMAALTEPGQRQRVHAVTVES